MEVEQKTNSNAIISLVLGIMSILIPVIGFVLGIIGIILSIKSKSEIKQTNDVGKPFATWGLILSIIGILLHIFVIIGFIAFAQYVVTDVSTYSTY